MRRWLIVLLMVPGLLLVAAMLGISLLVLQFFPAYLTWVALGVMAVVGLWFVFGRRGPSGIVAGSESSLMGRQTSKDGLL